VRHALDPTLDGGPSDQYLSVLAVGGTYFRVAVAPIVLDGFTIGTALLGDRLNAARLRALQRTFGGELLITADGAVLASTLDAAAVSARAAGGAAEGARPRAIRVGDGEYIVASLEIGATARGGPVELTLLQAVTPTLRRTTRALAFEFAVCGLLAIALAGFGAALLARTVLGPLEAFVRHLRASVGTSDPAEHLAMERWRRPSGRRDGDARVAVEIRWLHLSFARLMASLARKRVQLAYQAYHDPLTGLANRARFRMDVDRALGRRPGAHDAVAVLFLDLDHFKMVNDSLGHAVGDQLLVEVASRLLHATRGCDTVARLGGDEFAVLIDGVRDDTGLLTVVERIQRAMRAPVRLERAEVLVGASVGVARAGPGDRAEELLRNADVAMYRAKQRGRGACEIFAPAMHAAVVERLELEGDLRRALARPEGELRLVYQAIVALEDGRAAGFEALARWEHPTRGAIGPTQFIPLAEATGLIIPLGRWVLRTACGQAAQWREGAQARRRGPSDGPYVSVNLSGRQLDDPSLVDEVAAALAEARLDPSRLLLEITETTLVQRAEAVMRTLHALKSLGVRLAVDDFGTGYSSLAYLQRFPVDVVKIDKAFVDGVSRGGSEEALARGIVGLAGALGLRCVAEGIERAEQADALRAAGCVYGQGFLYGGMVAADETVVIMSAQPYGRRRQVRAPRTRSTP
jgi:diguanylate cyclase (GGDEF)-like protein